MRLSKKKLRYFIKDEKKAIKEYRKYGLSKLAKDENKHRKYLMTRLKRKKISFIYKGKIKKRKIILR